MQSYADHPLPAVEAYSVLRLADIRSLLTKLATVLNYGTNYIDSGPYYNRDVFVNDQKEQVEFLLDQLYEYGIDAKTYAEAAQGYIKLLNAMFSSSVHTPRQPSNVAVNALPPPYPRIA